ncbi:hypothetical protein [Pseudoduganella lutea]|uniref:Uncharacterized protein n=1 Tax=Pseudoduganella lutea TaxID=321985 RepID=A0A4V0Z3E8_9BURK|nr:hypothetical protein [Pseudoduganella lutea]QBE63193.1 hypothetical protein EWM63_09645 [Pseudoduganella lutea]
MKSIQTTAATTTPTLQYITLKSDTASKLGKYAEGSISYTLQCDPSRTALFVAISDNSSGGYFSREYVPVDRIQELVGNPNKSAFPSKALKIAFTGKSSNNAGFLAAILHAEGLLARATDNEAKHVPTGDWVNWKTALLALESNPADTSPPSAQSADVSAGPEKRKTLTLKRAKPASLTE